MEITKLALSGAGGKMSVRLSRNLDASVFDTAHVEVSQEGRGKLNAELGHSCHPLVFDEDNTTEERKDYFGGDATTQGIVNALMQGPETHYTLGEKVGKTIFAPVARSHRVTVEQI